MSLSMEDRLQRRKLDALKRGIHRVTGGETLAMASHVIGIGKAGIEAIAAILRAQQPGAPKITALAVDIGDQDLQPLRTLAASLSAELAKVTTLELSVPDRSALLGAQGRYADALRLEYPQYRWSPETSAWLDEDVILPVAGSHFPRAVAKAIYGYHYYMAPRPAERALRNFAAAIENERAQSVVAVIFGLGGGTGSGIAVDLARHLSNGLFGRRVLVAGIGIAPCDGDAPAHRGAALFPVINELDVLGDEGKNNGVTQSCGELFRNPFTAGFILVPQHYRFGTTGDLAATHAWVDEQIASLVCGNSGAHLWELLRLLNWVAAPSTQHSAARTPWGPEWIHMLGALDLATPPDDDLAAQFGLADSYHAEYIEVRVPAADTPGVAGAVAAIESAFNPQLPPQVVAGGLDGAAQFILPRVRKQDLVLFRQAREAYHALSLKQKQLAHSMLLDQGVVLCEPSTRLTGMAGAGLAEGDNWIAVPLAEVWGDAVEESVRAKNWIVA